VNYAERGIPTVELKPDDSSAETTDQPTKLALGRTRLVLFDAKTAEGR
jgi:hypothetical protein